MSSVEILKGMTDKERKKWFRLEKKKIKESDPFSAKRILERLTRFASRDEVLPISLGACFGLLTGAETERTPEGAARQALEGALFAYMASRPNALPSNVFGVAGLVALGLNIPLTEAQRQVAPSIEQAASTLEAGAKLARSWMDNLFGKPQGVTPP